MADKENNRTNEKELGRQLAVALGYEPDKMLAPKVLAKGRGEVAKAILKVAREAGIPVKEDSDLVQVLEKLDIDAEIPPELYKVVAEVLAFVYRMSGEAKQK